MQEAPQLTNSMYILTRRSHEQKKLVAAAELTGQMLLLPLKNVGELLGQWVGDWLSLALVFLFGFGMEPRGSALTSKA
jgi:hypothetical protein